ncbi:hypothetical protein BASA62_009113 [Batrachochytrium salamandrivorans]|nr:hypothetical protein BASA62_009113 [Batrachochytrium salamandrivorans]
MLDIQLQERSYQLSNPSQSPDKFDGTRRNFPRAFINQLELVFQLQAVDMTRIEKDRYARNSIKLERTRMVQPVPGETRSLPYDLSTWPRFKRKISVQLFGEINQEQVSEARLRALKQGKSALFNLCC